MKRIIIICLIILVCLLSLSYHKARQQEQSVALIQAAYEGNLVEVKDLLAQGAAANYVLYLDDDARHYKKMDFTLLQAAASSGNEKLISYLIEKQQDINQTNHLHWTALFFAIRDAKAETAARLIQAGADVNISTDTGSTPLLMAMLADFPTEKEPLMLAEYLLKRNADPNAQTLWKTDALFYAVTERKDKQLIELLLSYQADICRRYNGKILPELADKSLQPFLRKRYQQICAKKRGA